MSIISRLTIWTVGQILKSADLNNEFSNITNLFNNLDGGTTTWTNVNATTSVITTLTPTTLTHGMMKYRRPVLQYNSGTVVNMETGINGTSGQAQILFPDGSLRTDSTAGRIQMNISQNAVLSGAAQGGLRTGSVANNTWYACYAVKTTDNTNNFVHVADTVLPIQANFSTLNTNFGTNGWVYLGMVRNGDNSGSATGILTFIQVGNFSKFYNVTTGNNIAGSGVRLATTAGATSLTYTYAVGTGAAQIPNNVPIGLVQFSATSASTAGSTLYEGTSAGGSLVSEIGGGGPIGPAIAVTAILTQGLFSNHQTSVPDDIFLKGFWDGVLGISGNSIL